MINEGPRRGLSLKGWNENLPRSSYKIHLSGRPVVPGQSLMYMVRPNITMLATNTRGRNHANHGSGAGGKNCGGGGGRVLWCCASMSEYIDGGGGSPFPFPMAVWGRDDEDEKGLQATPTLQRGGGRCASYFAPPKKKEEEMKRIWVAKNEFCNWYW